MRTNACVTLHHVGVILPSRELIGAYRDLTRLEISCDEYVEAFDCDYIFLGDHRPLIELIVPRGGRLGEFNKGALPGFAWLWECGKRSARDGTFRTGRCPSKEPSWTTRACMPRMGVSP